MLLEIACFEITSAETALSSAADRIELCADGHLGGTTPDIEEFRYLRGKFQKPINVMVRPRGGDFYYSDSEFDVMKRSLQDFYNAGADGFVFGILNSNHTIDEERSAKLLALAGGRPCTFHRAIDDTPDLDSAFETLIRLGFKTVLTSGGAKSAVEGKHRLSELVSRFGTQIDVLLGGGVRSGNIADLREVTGATNFHSSAILP